MILPAEIRSRELDARIVMGLMAVHRGWRVVLGSKALINRNIWRFPRGVYLCQTLTRRRVAMLRLLERLGGQRGGWCEEGLIYQSREVYLERRVASETLERLSCLVAWGDQSKGDLSPRAETAGTEIHALGNPRLDLLRLARKGLYDEQVADLTGRFGDFVLVNTNFSNVNWAPESAARSASQGSGETEASRRYEAFREYRRQIFDGFLAMVPELARRLPDQLIVIRPHPAEDVVPWEAVAEQTPNVVVQREGGVAPWILASKALIHNGCTTAVEAALLGRCPIAYCPVVKKDLDAVLSNDISDVSESVAGLAEKVLAIGRGDLRLTTHQFALLDHHAASRQGPLATERILELFERVAESGSAPGPRLGARAFAVARHGYKALRRGHQTDRYIPTVFPDTCAEEVAARADVFARFLGLPSGGVRVRELCRNVFEMSPA
ncbi:MAG: hypothetical protein HRU14_16175 [Planctomycetes bacterium]|nr:hypothetical protein [Planctomycetota bacterium]